MKKLPSSEIFWNYAPVDGFSYDRASKRKYSILFIPFPIHQENLFVQEAGDE